MTQLSNAVRDNPAMANEARETYQALLSRSTTDIAFRQQLLTNPRAAFATFTGKNVSEIPESVNVKFIENAVDATIVLPDFVDSEAELSDRELETVAGGSDVIMTIALSIWALDGALASYLIAKK